MKILGISAYYHDSAICLLEDGELLYAAQEERFSRIKNDECFPKSAIQNCLKELNINIKDIDVVVYYEKPFLKLERIFETYLNVAPKGFFSFLQAMHVWTKEKLFIKQNIYKELRKIDDTFDKNKVQLLFSEHHLSHAASAFYPSPFSEAAVLTIDGVGEFATTSLAYGKDNQLRILKEIHFPDSVGLLYAAITYFLGFKVNNDEYKVMGLAAYGNKNDTSTKEYIEIIEQKLIQINDDGSYILNIKNFKFHYGLTMVDDADWERLFGVRKRESNENLAQEHCNLAYAFQKVTEKLVLNLCYEIQKITQSRNLCLAGGVALNCVINGIIKDNKVFDNVFIQSASGDAGGALGCALAVYHQYFGQERKIQFPDAMKNSLLGNSFSKNEVELIQQQHQKFTAYKTFDEVCKVTATHIAHGKVIGWFQNRMEFGPRALGNRSILADARNEQMQLHLNLKIKNRESFRPFAPAILEEDAKLYFDIEGTSPYMLQVHQINKNNMKPLPDDYEKMNLKEKLYFIKSTIPAVTHVDGSARIQTVNKNTHPKFYRLLTEFKEQTGCGVLINTSFNVKDEPIVCTPNDAYNCFLKTGIDFLVIGNVIFHK